MSEEGSATSRSGVTFVGAGPGDPGLVTFRAHRALAEAGVVIYDADLPGTLLDAVPPGAERIAVNEGTGARGRAASGPEGVPADAVPALLVDRVRAGYSVVRLMRGDGGAFGREAAAVAAAGLALEVIPGVGLGSAAAALAGVPLTPATRVAVVANGDLAAAAARLRAEGAPGDLKAVAIEAPGAAEQRTVAAPLDEIAGEAGRLGLNRTEVLVAGEGVGGRVPWRERQPLHGRRLLVTRPRAQAGRFVALLEGYGAEVVVLPTIRLEPPDDWRPLDEAIARLAEFAWIVFTSANGVTVFQERLGRAGRDARALAGLGVAAIGAVTAEALRRTGIAPDVVPEEFRAEGLVEALASRVQAGRAVLLVRAAEAREVLPRELRARGVSVVVAPAYRTVTPKEEADHVLGLLEHRRIDAVTFTSSSTVRGLVALLPPGEARRLLSGVVLAAIGPITAATIAEYGLTVSVMPREYTVPALAAAIARHFAGRDPAARR
jgi:uroporphyrinogen III methyltransferase / synthase